MRALILDLGLVGVVDTVMTEPNMTRRRSACNEANCNINFLKWLRAVVDDDLFICSAHGVTPTGLLKIEV